MTEVQAQMPLPDDALALLLGGRNEMTEKVVEQEVPTLAEVPVLADADAASSSTAAATSNMDYFKKAKVAVTGGVVTAVGLVMIPAPLPIGAIITAYGVSILAQEFEGAQTAIDKGKTHLEGGLQKLAESLHVKELEVAVEEGDNGNIKQEQQQETASSVTEESAGQPIETTVDDSNPDDDNDNDNVTSDDIATGKAAEPELSDILQDDKQTLLEGAGKVWNLHARNARKVTCRFITDTVLPALRQVDIEATTDTTTNSKNNVDDNASAVPGSTQSIASSLSSDSSDDSDGADTDDEVLPVRVKGMCEEDKRAKAEIIKTTESSDDGAFEDVVR